MKLAILIYSSFEAAALRHAYKYSAYIPIDIQFPCYVYLSSNTWSWSERYYHNEGYTLAPLQAILQPQDYPEYYI